MPTLHIQVSQGISYGGLPYTYRYHKVYTIEAYLTHTGITRISSWRETFSVSILLTIEDAPFKESNIKIK